MKRWVFLMLLLGLLCGGVCWQAYAQNAPSRREPSTTERKSKPRKPAKKRVLRKRVKPKRSTKKSGKGARRPVSDDDDDDDDNDDDDDGDAREPGDEPPPEPRTGPASLIKQRQGAKVFLFLSPVRADATSSQGAAAIGTVVLKLAVSRLNRLESVRLKTFQQMPGVPQVMAQYGDLEKLDRVSLIAIKNATGFDGLIRTKYRLDAKGIDLTMTFIDFRNGRVFRKRRLRQPLGAAVFQIIEQDMVAFATMLRRSYRVTLRIQSQPPGGRVSINGKYVGNAPLLQELRTGTHDIEVAAKGYQAYRTRMFLKSGDKLLLRAVLPKARVAFVITAEPKQSNVFIDGRLVGQTPMKGFLAVGRYRIEVRNKGYKTYRTAVALKPGDRLQLHAPLYNPLAARFLNAKPAFRLDTRQIHVGYRYVYLGLDRPKMNDINFIDFSFLMRMYWFELGIRVSPSVGIATSNPIDSFLGQGEGIQHYNVNLLQVHAVFKYALWEKYSFASVYVGTSLGLTLSTVNSEPKDELFRGSFSIEAFASLVSRLFRGGNFSLELQFDLGFAYLGQLLYKERRFNLFGQATEAEVDKPIFGPYGAFSLRLVFWNGIF